MHQRCSNKNTLDLRGVTIKKYVVSIYTFLTLFIFLIYIGGAIESTTLNTIKLSTDIELSNKENTPTATPIMENVRIYKEIIEVYSGQDFFLTFEAENPKNDSTMHVQVFIILPTGMNIISSDFFEYSNSSYTTSYELKPGFAGMCRIPIHPNQVGDFDIKGGIIYYFDEDIEHFENYTLFLPVKVHPSEKDFPLSGRDLKFGISYILISSILTFGLIRVFKVKKLQDIMTIFAAIYGTLISLYFLWKL